MIGMLNQSNFPEQRVFEFGYFGQFLALITNIISGNDDVLKTGPLCCCSRVQKSADCRTNNKK
jgi:hypothetical protein